MAQMRACTSRSTRLGGSLLHESKATVSCVVVMSDRRLSYVPLSLMPCRVCRASSSSTNAWLHQRPRSKGGSTYGLSCWTVA
jgi:hypothetical protein